MLNIYRCCWPVSTISHHLPDLLFRGERHTRLGLAPWLRHVETCPVAPINVHAIELQSMNTEYLNILISYIILVY